MTTKKSKTSQLLKKEIKKLQEDILNIWGDYEVPDHVLEKPTPEFVNTFFIRCIKEFYSSFSEVFEYVEVPLDISKHIQEDAFPEMALFSHLSNICNSFEIYFPLTMFYQPSPINTRKVMSQIIEVLSLFKTNRMDLLKSTKPLSEFYKTTAARLNSINQLKEERSELYRRHGELLEEEVELQETENALNLEEQELAKELKEIEVLEQKSKQLEAKVKELENKIAQIDSQNSNLERTIVLEEDYRLALEALENLRVDENLLTNEWKYVLDKSQNLRENIQHLKNLEAIFDSIDPSTWNCLTKIKENVGKIAETEGSLEEIKHRVDALLKEIRRNEAANRLLLEEAIQCSVALRKCERHIEEYKLQLEKETSKREGLLKKEKQLKSNIHDYVNKQYQIRSDIDKIKASHLNTLNILLEISKQLIQSANLKEK